MERLQSIVIASAVSTSPDALNSAIHERGAHSCTIDGAILSRGTEVNLCCEGCSAVVTTFHVYSLGRGARAKLDTKTNLRNQMASRRFQMHRKKCKSHLAAPSQTAAGAGSSQHALDEGFGPKLVGAGPVIPHAATLPLELFDSMLMTLFQRRATSMALRDSVTSDSSTAMRYQYLVCPRMNVTLVADYGQDCDTQLGAAVTLPVRLGLDCRGTVSGVEFIKLNIPGVSVNDLNEPTFPADLDKSILHPLINDTDLQVQWIDVGLTARCLIGLQGVDAFAAAQELKNTSPLIQLLRCKVFGRAFAVTF